MSAVIPFIPTIAGAIGGIFGGKKATQSAQQRSPEETAALTGAQGAGTALGQQGASLFGTGTNLLTQGASTLAGPQSYFSRLLSGNRALQSQAIAAPRSAIEDTYGGAERSLERSGVRGASRDVAVADLARQKAGQISSLITGVQPGAANALTGIAGQQFGAGLSAAGQGVGATQAGGGIFANLLGQGFQNRTYARDQGQQFGQGFGGLIFDLLKGVNTKFGKATVGG